nr:SDR family oxidoreductase [uncultured Bacteroides sp.]
MKLAIITGADGGMGMEITRAVAIAGYRIIMACRSSQAAEPKRQLLIRETGNSCIEVKEINLASLSSVSSFANELLEQGEPLSLLMNNAGTMETKRRITEDGLEQTVAVNYVGPYLLTRKLLPLMGKGSRIVNMVSCTYSIGKIDFPDFFLRGKKGSFWRIPIYSNTKLALSLFTIDLANRVKYKGIIVNAADPGIVSTNIITMHLWFDPLTDILFRPFIRTPRQGAATAISLLLDEEAGKRTGTLNVSCHPKRLSDKYTRHVQMRQLWDETERIVKKWL